MNSEDSFLFILGRGRSGTTLLKSILNKHPQISVADEAMFVLMLNDKYSNITFWDKKTIHDFIDDIYLEDRFLDWGLTREYLLSDISQIEGEHTYEEVCRYIYRCYAKFQNKSGIRYLGDKNPHYTLFANFLNSTFNNAKFIHIVRDCRDNVASYKNVSFDLNNLTALAYRWKQYNLELLNFSRENPKKVCLVKYEELVSNPLLELKKICTFLEIEFVEDLILFENDVKNREYSKKYSSFHSNLQKPINSNQINSWRKKLTDKEVEKCEAVAGEMMDKLGYKLETNKDRISLGMSFWIIFAHIVTLSEKIILMLPFSVKFYIVRLYRKITKTIQ